MPGVGGDSVQTTMAPTILKKGGAQFFVDASRGSQVPGVVVDII